jgi:hypothetical protein
MSKSFEDEEVLFYVIQVVKNVWPLILGFIAIVFVFCKFQSSVMRFENRRK